VVQDPYTTLRNKEFEAAKPVERERWRFAGGKFDCRLGFLIDLAMRRFGTSIMTKRLKNISEKAEIP
jgi:hypothetical protein